VSHLRVLWRRVRSLAVRSTAATGRSGGCALVLVAIGILTTLTEVVSPSFLLWSGHAVADLNLGGTLNYRYRGIQPNNFTGPTRRAPNPTSTCAPSVSISRIYAACSSYPCPRGWWRR